MSYNRPSATNPVSEPQHIPASEMARIGHSYSPSPDHPGERVGDSSHRCQQTSLQYVNHANIPAQGGYVYMAEPGILRGVSDVDVDEKPHVVYETMAEVHLAKQNMMNRDGGGGVFKPSGENVASDYSSTSDKSRRGNGILIPLIMIIWNLFLFVLIAGAFGLSVYTFLGRNEVVVSSNSSPITTETPSNGPSSNTQDTQAQLQMLNDTIAELRVQIDQVNATHEDRYNALNASIITAVQSVQTVVPTDELDLYAGCVEDTSECVLDPMNVGTTPLPAHTSCETSAYDLNVEGFTNTDMYCHIDNSAMETNPITSTLNIFGGEVGCLCTLVALATPTAHVTCKLVIRRCPDTIRLNTTTMR